MRRLNPPQIITLSYLATVMAGALLLCFPISVVPGKHISFVDALFTSTSALSLTGLSVQDTGTFFSLFGQFVIIFLIQVGGLGIMTFSTLFAIIIGKKLNIRQNFIAQSAFDSQDISQIKYLVKNIILLTVGIELLGAFLLFISWTDFFKHISWGVLYSSIFHSIAAFCNSGFSLFPNSLSDYRGDVFVNFTMCALIVLGGLGFIVLADLMNISKVKPSERWFRLSLQSKIALIMSAILIFIGAVLLFFIGFSGYSFSELGLKDRFLASVFQSVSARTAGFSTVDISTMSIGGLFVLIILMFIGASPGSTGGGIKTVTFWVLIAAMGAMFNNKNRIVLFKKTIPKLMFRRAFCVVFLSVVLIFIATFLLCITDKSKTIEGGSFIKNLFEVVSAFGTVGFSTGITGGLSVLGKLVIIITMFTGKIGLFTLAIALTLRSEKVVVYYPEEKIMVG